MHPIQKLLSLLFSFVLCTSLSAQPPEGKIETDRPDQTESPFIVPRNYFQLEFGLNMEKYKVQELIQPPLYYLPVYLNMELMRMLNFGSSFNPSLQEEEMI